MRAHILAVGAFLSLTTAAVQARGEPESEVVPQPNGAASGAVVPNKPLQYSLPWQLRPLPAASVVRADTSIAHRENAVAQDGLTITSLVTVGLRIPHTGPKTAGLTVLARAAVIEDSPPGSRHGFAVVNPLVGASYALKLADGLRLNFFAGATIPVGMGGGNDPARGALVARSAGPNARSQLDNALYASNDVGVISGVGFGWIGSGWTFQVDATLFHLIRVRGRNVQPEATKTNTTFGLHVGYFLISSLSIGAELRYQRWLNAPFGVEADVTDASKDNLTVAAGPRAHIHLGGSLWLRPGISYSRGLDKPLAGAKLNMHIFQVDVPLLF